MPMWNTDTLTADTALVRQLQANPDYRYVGEADEQVSWLSYILRWVGRQLDFSVDYRVWLTVFGIIVAGVVVWFVAKNGGSLFRRLETRGGGTDDLARDIHSIDFGREIAAALRRKDWSRAVRLVYLQTLKQLSDGGRIDWQPYKTPTQYLYEVDSPAFRQLTNLFLQVRYGNYEAVAAMVDDARRWQEETGKGGEA